LQIVGVPYRNAAQVGQFASALAAIRLDRDRASVLLNMLLSPEIAEAAGVSLQLFRAYSLGQFILGAGWRGGFTGSLYTLKPHRENAGFTSAEQERGTAASAGIRIPRL